MWYFEEGDVVFEEGGVVFLRGWHGTLKRAMCYFEYGDVVL